MNLARLTAHVIRIYVEPLLE